MKTISDYKPQRLEYMGYGKYRFSWNITEKTVEEDGCEPRTVYESDYVEVSEEPTADNITTAAITSLCDVNREQKLINEYNSAKMGLLSEEESEQKVSAYEEYLQKRAALKAEVDAYFDVK